jgi:hypothetical protein
MMGTEKRGKAGPRVFPLALGCMGMGAGGWYDTTHVLDSER